MLQSEAGYIDARPHPPDRRKPLATHGRTIHWVNRVVSAMSSVSPVYPQLRTYCGIAANRAQGHNRPPTLFQEHRQSV